MVNHAVTTQATMIAYNNDFEMMMILTVCAIPLLVLLRVGKKASGDGDAPVVVE
jgi:DHA2 family multidrug resistance protein